MKTEYKTMSKRVKLLLNREEDYDVDWKGDINGLHSEDIVAFANSKNGGSILIGIDEIKDKHGKQKAKIVGCPITDDNKMRIKSKASSCISPINVEIIKENMNEKPFYRIEIPSGNNKPYCTQKGIYKVRGDGRNNAIMPNELLVMFMELESDKFITKFKKATEEIESSIYGVSNDIGLAIGHLDDILPQVESMEELSYIPDEILGYVEKVDSEVENINSTVIWNQKRILKLLDHFNIEDPLLTELKKSAKDTIKMHAEIGKNIKDKNYLEELSLRYSRLAKRELESCHKDALDEMNKKSSNK